MKNPPVDQAWLDQQVEEALAVYADKVAPADLAWMREQMLERLQSDPSLALLAHRAQPRTVDESSEIFYPRKDGQGVDPTEPTDAAVRNRGNVKETG